MVVNNNYHNNLNRVQRPIESQSGSLKQQPVQTGESFESILQGKINGNTGVKYSKHAEMRLQMRNIDLTTLQKQKVDDAVKKAEGKGIKDTLVIMDNIALVVNVKSKTVITAVTNNELKENVFTNIDGAVFA